MRGESGPRVLQRTTGCLGETERADGDVVSDRFGDLRQYRHHSGFIAFAQDDNGVGAAANVSAFETERLRQAQTGAVKQSQHCGIACENPWRASLAFACIGGGNLHGG